MRAPIAVLALIALVAPAAAQRPAPDPRAQIAALRIPPLRFNPPTAKRVTLSNGVAVYLLEDHSFPLIDVEVLSKVGVANLPDSLWGVGWQADNLMRTGGTTRLSPDSVDRIIEFYALSVFLSTGTRPASRMTRRSDRGD